MRGHLTKDAQHQLEESFRNDDEAHNLIALIAAEFESDPTSTQCFDLRVVERVRSCAAARAAFVKAGPFF